MMLITEYYGYKNGGDLLAANNTIFDYVWTLLINPIYNVLYSPMFTTIIPTTTKQLNTKKNLDFPIIAILLILGILFEAAVYAQVLNIERHIRSSLLL